MARDRLDAAPRLPSSAALYVQSQLRAIAALELAEQAVSDPDGWPILSALVRADGPYLPRGEQTPDVRHLLATVTHAR